MEAKRKSRSVLDHTEHVANVLASFPLSSNSAPTEQLIATLILGLSVAMELFDRGQVLAIFILKLLYHQLRH